MKKLFGIVLTAALAFGAVGCGGTTTTTDETGDTTTNTSAESVTIKVGANPTPQAEILKAAQPEPPELPEPLE